jgi:ribosomal protein S1
MEQEKTNLPDESRENFAQLLEEYQYERPKRGQLLEGEIEKIDDQNIILDIGAKRAAIVSPREVKQLDDELIENISVGDVIPVQVTRTPTGDENLLVSLDGAMEYKSWESAAQLMDQDTTLDLHVIAYNRGGVIVRFDQLDGFVPNSLIPTLRKINNRKLVQKRKQEMIRTQLQVKPIEVNQKMQTLVFSALEAQKEKRQRRLAELEVGEIVEGTVVNLVSFGAFIELGGVDGLLHISEMDWRTVKYPSEVVSIGDRLRVEVIQIDREQERISVSRKALLPSPWQKVANTYQPGNLLEVKIVNVVDFGAFAELPEGVQGLIHISELGYPVAEDMKVPIQIGETVLVKILNIDVERQRVSLSMKQVPGERQRDWLFEHFPKSDHSGK